MQIAEQRPGRGAGQRRQSRQITAVIIQDRQRQQLRRKRLRRAFVIHLPELIGRGALKALRRRVALVFGARQPVPQEMRCTVETGSASRASASAAVILRAPSRAVSGIVRPLALRSPRACAAANGGAAYAYKRSSRYRQAGTLTASGTEGIRALCREFEISPQTAGGEFDPLSGHVHTVPSRA